MVNKLKFELWGSEIILCKSKYEFDANNLETSITLTSSPLLRIMVEAYSEMEKYDILVKKLFIFQKEKCMTRFVLNSDWPARKMILSFDVMTCDECNAYIEARNFRSNFGASAFKCKQKHNHGCRYKIVGDIVES